MYGKWLCNLVKCMSICSCGGYLKVEGNTEVVAVCGYNIIDQTINYSL